MIALFALGSASAFTRTVSVCVDYEVAFTDAVASGNGIGDHWDVNGSRAANSLKYRLTTSADEVEGYLDTAGCMSEAVEMVGASTQTFTFRVFSTARRRGIDIEYRFNDTPDGDPADGNSYRWEDAETQAKVWIITSSPTSGVHNRVIEAVDGWQFLAVATWMIHRNDWNIPDSVSRSCCVPPFAGADGTCSAPFWPAARYLRTQDPYLPAQPKLFVQGFYDEGSGNPNGVTCCGSRIKWSGAPSGTDEFVVGFGGGADEPRRYSIAHELGHVLVGLRMGGREDNMYYNSAPLDECMGDYRSLDLNESDPSLFPLFPVDAGTPDARGGRTKEYMSTVAREGWADWVSAWAWNAVGGSDCEVAVPSYADFDLDGDLDNWYGDTDYRNGAVDCLGTPELFVANPADPTGAFLTDVSWLGDVLDAGRCDPFTGPGCANATQRANMESRNRAAPADFQRMAYQLFKLDGMAPEDLSDLYVNTCPRAWRPDDGACSIADDLPLERLLISGGHLEGLGGAWDFEDELVSRIDALEH